VDNLRATVAKKTITAPFSGTLGIRQVNKGEYLNAGAAITSLQAMTPVYVDFTVPQQDLSRVRQNLKIVALSDAYPGREFEGHISALDADVDVTTRSITVRATVPNSEKLLRPGMFVTVEVIMTEPLNVIRVPATAVSYEPYGDSVYIIEDAKDPKTGAAGKKLRRQLVRLGEARGDFVAVTEGLKPGETVASTGVFKLRNEMPVEVNNNISPKAELDPKPQEG
jgi:membrane fusion protein (multidrug efflux system)